MTQTEPRDVSPEDALRVFRKATGGMEGSGDRWAKRATQGMTDDELITALKWEMGEYCGWCGPDSISGCSQKSGLRIWASWNTVSPERETKPIYLGMSTVRMAREVYGVKDPTDKQMDLF